MFNNHEYRKFSAFVRPKIIWIGNQKTKNWIIHRHSKDKYRNFHINDKEQFSEKDNYCQIAMPNCNANNAAKAVKSELEAVGIRSCLFMSLFSVKSKRKTLLICLGLVFFQQFSGCNNWIGANFHGSCVSCGYWSCWS